MPRPWHQKSHALGVLNGGDVPPYLLKNWTESADYVLAADGAGDRLMGAKLPVDVVIGDFDSLSRDPAEFPEAILVPDQNFSDCDKLLSVAEARFEALTVIGVEGDALDHLLASLLSFARSRLPIRIVLRTGFGFIIRPGCSCSLLADGKVSLLPLTPCQGVDLIGVQWPLSNAELDPLGLVSLSNHAHGEEVRASLESGAALLVVTTLPIVSWPGVHQFRSGGE